MEELYSKLQRGPSVLFLGQNYLSIETGTDPFLNRAIEKFCSENPQGEGYYQLLTSEIKNNPINSFTWLTNYVGKLAIPDWVDTVANFPWNNIYTSAIDNLWVRSFRSISWRQISSIYSEKYKPLDPRNPMQLQCTFLFGCINQLEGEGRPPSDNITLKKRKQEAISIARRLPEIVTPFGVLIIEGYSLNDWFLIDDFLPIIDDMLPEQTHIFSYSSDFPKNDFVNYLLQNKKIVLHQENFATYISQEMERGHITVSTPQENHDIRHRIQFKNSFVTIPTDVWNQVSHSAIILDDHIAAPIKEVGEEKLYDDFLNFLAESSTKPIWDGYKKGFAFQREFESNFQKEVKKQLQSKELHDDPIILHGQTGTGKTISLGRLAFEIKKTNRYAILFIERKPKRPSYSDLDTFCKWAEDNGAESSLIIWDGMVEVDTYYSTLQHLTSRGRKLVLVGSCYRQLEESRGNFFEAPSTLTSTEKKDFELFLNKIAPDLGNLLSRYSHDFDEHFLVALYRLLPPTRGSIIVQLNKEVRQVEESVIQRALEEIDLPTTSLASALFKAGIVKKEEIALNKTKIIDGENVNEIQELIGLIMVPGKFGLQVPFELIVRAMSKGWMDNLVEILSHEDIFRWGSDQIGNILIGPRHPLEASIIVRSRLGTAKAETNFAKRLLIEIQPHSQLDSSEVTFAIDFLRSVGPNGQNPRYYAPTWLDYVDTLEELRTNRGIENPRLMLQEALFIREWIIWNDKEQNPLENSDELHEKAKQILIRALELTKNEYRSKKLNNTILVEIGANIASQTKCRLNDNSYQIPYKHYLEAINYLHQAIVGDTGDFHPLDVLFWMTEDLLKSDLLPNNYEIELLADLLHAFSIIDPYDLDVFQQERYHSRYFRLGALTSKINLTEEAFTALKQMGSKAGYYLKAVDIAGELNFNNITARNQVSCKKAVEYLEANRNEITGDIKCLLLLLRLWWISKTGNPILFEERQTLSFSQDLWKFIYDLASEILETGDLFDSHKIRFLQGISSFHLNDLHQSLSIFRELERDSNDIAGRRRIIRSYLVSTDDGKPKEFNGNVHWINIERNRGKVYVEELLSEIAFLPLDFPGGRDLVKYDSIGPFHIAFNFIGPIADPIMFYRQRKKK